MWPGRGPSPSAGCVAIGVIPYPGLLGKLRALHAWNSRAQMKHLHLHYISYYHTHTGFRSLLALMKHIIGNPIVY